MKLGDKGESLSVKLLQKQGYKLITRNYQTPFGEIDIIASDGETLVFVEVKTRENLQYGRPFEAVTSSKRRKIAQVALHYLKGLKQEPPCRFDVVSISYEKGAPQCELIRDAFDI